MTSGPPANPKITVLTTLYGSEPFVEELYRRTRDVLARLTEDYEFVFVDDGSPDRSKAKALALCEADPHVRLVELSRNFGHHKAVMAGLAYATGDYVFLFDSDLEEDPELLATFYHAMMEKPGEIDVVYGIMEQRKGTLAERLPGALFYKLINAMSDVHIPANQMAARLMTQEYVQSLLAYQESHVFLGGVMMLNGYTQVGIHATKGSKGTTTYTFRKKLSQAMDALVSFTNKPLTFIAMGGLYISAFAFISVIVLLVRFALYDIAIEPWVWVLASLWFLGGLIIASVGLVGFYVGRVFLQVKQRPNAVVKRVHN